MTRKAAILSELGVTEIGPAVIPSAISRPPGRRIRLGLIGVGGEGESLLRHAGFAHPDWIRDARTALEKDPLDKQLEVYLNQEDLNVVFTGVCDLFDVRAERAVAASRVDVRPRGAPANPPARRFRSYTEMLQSGEVDAVIVATPDHWHARICQDAAAAGIHVYCEKALTRTEEEAHAVYAAVKKSKIVFQLGHQNRQSESHNKAREIIAANILGPITLVEATTNRNSKWGAWVWDIHKDGNPATIDWAQFEEPAAHKVPFSLERFFRWRCWYDYGTGLAGDLLSHEFDGVNQILQLGIPQSCVLPAASTTLPMAATSPTSSRPRTSIRAQADLRVQRHAGQRQGSRPPVHGPRCHDERRRHAQRHGGRRVDALQEEAR